MFHRGLHMTAEWIQAIESHERPGDPKQVGLNGASALTINQDGTFNDLCLAAGQPKHAMSLALMSCPG